MIKIEQTFTPPKDPLGNCFVTCIACILELPLEILPCPMKAYEAVKDDWWFKHYSDLIIFFTSRNKFLCGYAKPKNDAEYCIIVDKSPREGLHAVVGIANKVVFDPHPSNDGILETESRRFYYIEKDTTDF